RGGPADGSGGRRSARRRAGQPGPQPAVRELRLSHRGTQPGQAPAPSSLARRPCQVCWVRRAVSDVRAGADAGGPALERPPLVLAQAAPHTGVLAALQGPREARLQRRATLADLLGLVDLIQGRSGAPDREEQLWILVAAGGMVTPVHEVHSSVRAEPWPGARSR